MIHDDLTVFYRAKGVLAGQYHIGPEHPGLEERAMSFLRGRASPTVLEIGYQSGGFAVPVIISLDGVPGFKYVGIDNLDYNQFINSPWNVSLLAKFLESKGVSRSAFEFNVGDANRFLRSCNDRFDVILIDHLKRLYPRELKTILRKRLMKPGGIILMHDVLKRAEAAWVRCETMCRVLSCKYEVDKSVVSGLAIVTPDDRLLPRTATGWLLANLRVMLASAGSRSGVNRS